MTEELKKQTLDHWRDNLRRLKAMDWKKWLTYNRWDKAALMQGDPFTPQMYSSACPLCTEYFHKTCGDCPLARSTHDDKCCEEWLIAHKAMLHDKYKKNAIAAFRAMIKRIEEIEV